MDFGGSGLPLIFVQDIHNSFEDEDPYFRDLWARFYARFTDEQRMEVSQRRKSKSRNSHAVDEEPMKVHRMARGQSVVALTVALALAGCGAAPDASEPTAPDALNEEARAFMEGYAVALLDGDADDIAARYSRRGAYMVLPGERGLVPYDTIARRYREGGTVADVFQWQDLAYEVVGEDRVLVVGAFEWRSSALGGVLGSYTALLIREDGELRIRLENESFDNLPPPACAGRPEPCDLPLDTASLARYAGEYDTPGGEGRTRVFAEDGRLMMEGPGTPPGRLLYEGAHAFRLVGVPSFRVVFDGGGERATSYVAFTGIVHAKGERAR